MIDRGRRFAVVVHDVAPGFGRHVERILRELGPGLAARSCAAVVPCWHGRAWGRADAALVRLVGDGFGELLQHGCTHRRARPGVVSWLTGGADELRGVGRDEVGRRLERGRAILRRVFGRGPSGFVAPAWMGGAATAEALTGAGFAGSLGYRSAWGPGFGPIPLATWSWDWGRVGALGWAGEGAGNLALRVRPGALPCVVVHPADVDRGFLPRCLRVIGRLEREGREPVLFSELIGATESIRAGGAGT